MTFSSPLTTLFSFFPELSATQKEQFAQLEPLYTTWNARINVISRKDIAHLYLHHILHSLSIAKCISFPAHSTCLDLGTGGGLPGIPLAILLPSIHFTLIDGRAKKIKVAQAIADALHLHNVTALPLRAEKLTTSYDFVVSRAVAPLQQLYQWSYPLLTKNPKGQLKGGIIALKGGDLTAELTQTPLKSHIFSIADPFPLPYFATKKIVFLSNQEKFLTKKSNSPLL